MSQKTKYSKAKTLVKMTGKKGNIENKMIYNKEA